MTVVYTTTARRQLDRLRAQPGGALVVAAVKRGIAQLEQFPKSGRVAKGGYRELVLTRVRYLIRYRLREGAIEIANIRHQARAR